MEDKSKPSLLDNHFTNTLTMHQPYANYPIYQPPTIAAPEYFPDLGKPVYVADSPEEKPQPAKKESRRGRSRNHYSPAQKEALEKAFLEEGIYVPIRKRDEMAKELNLTSKQVKIWYQNRRQKDKRREIRRKGGVIKVPMCADSPDSGVPEADEPPYQPSAVKQSVKKATKITTGLPATPPVYSYLSNAPQYPLDYSQTYPNYYNYDYLPAPMFPSNDYSTANPYALHQYFQYMSGFTSHQYSSTATESGSAALPVGVGGGLSQTMTTHPLTTTTATSVEPQSSFSAAY